MFGDYGAATSVVLWSMLLFNPLLLSFIDAYLVRQHRHRLLWGASLVLVVLFGVLYLLIRNPNAFGTDPTYVGEYPTIWQDPAQLLQPPFYFGLTALLTARRSIRANAAESWPAQLRQTLKTAFLSSLLAFPLGLLAEMATHKGPAI